MSSLSPSIGIVYDQIRPDERMIIDAAKRKGIPLQLYDAQELVVEASNPSRDMGFEDVILQRCVSYFKGLHLAALLENKGATVINSFEATSICGNKLLTSITLAKAGVPTPKTFVAFNSKSAMDAVGKLGYPATLKPVVGSWGRLVAPLNDPESAKAIFESRDFLFPLYQIFYIQELIQRPDRDIRCFVAGDRAIAAEYRYSPEGDWRTNAAIGGKAVECKITPEIEEISVKAAKAVGDGVFGVDIMESPGGLVVHEVNHSTEFKMLVSVSGVDVAGSILDYAVERVKR